MDEIEPSRSSRARPWIVGCVILALLGAIACGVGGWLLFERGSSFVTAAATAGMKRHLDSYPLRAADAQALDDALDRLQAASNAGDLGLVETFDAMSDVLESPPALAAFALGFGNYCQLSSLPPEEKERAQRDVARFARGILEEKISSRRFETRIPLSFDIDTQGGGAQVQVGDDEWSQIDLADLRERLADIRRDSDEAGIPDEPFDPDLASAIDAVVDAWF